MWYNLTPILIILVCAIVIIYILTKKFPAIADLDINSLPQEKEKSLKQRLIKDRFKRNVTGRWLLKLKKFFRPAGAMIVKWSKEYYLKLLSARDNLERKTNGENKGASKIDDLFSSAEDARKKDDLQLAEKNYIEIIGLDSKNISAFKMLGQLYLEMDKIQEAKETFEHVLKLTEEDAEVFANLAELAKKNNNLDKAKKHYQESIKLNNANGQNYFELAKIHEQQSSFKEAIKAMKEALKIEPNNPKYLDAMFEISILNKDKAEALDAYKTLKKINPENGKLKEMKKQIEDL